MKASTHTCSKKALSMLLSIALVISLFPGLGYADPVSSEGEAQPLTDEPASSQSDEQTQDGSDEAATLDASDGIEPLSLGTGEEIAPLSEEAAPDISLSPVCYEVDGTRDFRTLGSIN